MNYDKESEYLNNIYSEPLFAVSQGTCLSVSSMSQPTQTQESLACSTQFESRTRGGRTENFEESLGEESDEDSQLSPEFSFKLDSLVVRASKLTQDYCTTGCPHLDSILTGGIPAFGLTELYGEGGTGKTQLCLQLAITSQLPMESGGLNAGGGGGVYYICTEDGLPTKRLVELVQYFKKKFPDQLPADPMSNIFIEHVKDSEALMQCVDVKLANLARSSPDKKIRLVIVDSVAAIFRSEFDDLSQRTFELRRLAQTLQEHSLDHNAAVVVCNQVSGSLTYEGNIASLGMAWRNMITTRIGLSKKEEALRNLYVSFSPHVPPVGMDFQISSSGINGIPPT